jgi:hypothetical protein
MRIIYMKTRCVLIWLAAVPAFGQAPPELPGRDRIHTAMRTVNAAQLRNPVMKDGDRNWERGTWYTGGTTAVDGVSDRNRQENSRAGLTLAIPVGQQNSVKLAWSQGVSARFGGDLETYSLSWQYLWFRNQ